MFRKGIAPATQDFGLARFYYTQASEAGVAAAQHALGECPDGQGTVLSVSMLSRVRNVYRGCEC